MSEDLCRVELTASLMERLDTVEAFLTEADASFAFDDLLSLQHHRQLSFDFARMWPGA